MKKCTYYISLMLLACLCMVSCAEREIVEIDDSQYIELTVSCINLNATRADGDAATIQRGEDAYNENKINTIHYFLYQAGNTNIDAVMSGCFKNIPETQDDIYKLKIPMLEGDLNTIVFPIPAEECEVYLIANLPANADGSYNIPTKTDLASLKKMTIETVFQEKENDQDPTAKAFTPQSSFVMDGLGKARIVKRSETTAAKGEIQLDRLAAKFTVRISVDDTFTDTNGKTYTSDIEGMQVRLVRASNETTLEGALGVANFDYNPRGRKESQTVEKKVIDKTTQQETIVKKEMCVFEPFYSYPLSWEYKDNDALVLHITVPWKEAGEDRYKICHYKVFPSTLQLDRNNWYNIDLHIGVLGSFEGVEENWPEITGEYKVLNWNNGTKAWGQGLKINTDILGARYLVVEQNEYVVNNKNTFEIPFISSHKCTIDGWEVKQAVYDSQEKTLVLKPVPELKLSSISLTLEDNKKIKLNNTLNNDFLSEIDDNYDCTPYIFTINLRHEDLNYSSRFKETITLIQKPALCITAEKNSGTGDTYHGYQFVNGYHAVNTSTYTYGGAVGLTGATTDPYMYVIEVSVLPDGSEYILGDPRSITSTTNDNRLELDFTNFEDEAPGVEGSTGRKLTNYYGTPKMDASVKNMIAPKIRFASSHSTVQNFIDYNTAYNRAATYQEDGYLAGRWRVPTWAEMKFVAKLCSDEKMGQLLSGQVQYWCANGLVKATISNGKTTVELNEDQNANASMRSVRPVYDDWYWQHSDVYRLPEGSRNVFTWGDEGVPAPTTNN